MDCPIDWLHYEIKHWQFSVRDVSADASTGLEARDCLSATGSLEPKTPNQSKAVSIMATEREDLQTPCRKSRRVSQVLQMYRHGYVLPGKNQSRIYRKPRNYHGRRPLFDSIATWVKEPESPRRLMSCEYGLSNQLGLKSPPESPRLWLPRSTLQAAYNSPKGPDDSRANTTVWGGPPIMSNFRRVLSGYMADCSSSHSEMSCLERWDTAVVMYSTVTSGKYSALRISHDASFTVSHSQEDSFDKPTTLSVFIKNGPQIGGTYKLKSGEYTLQLPTTSDLITTEPGHTVEVVVEREPEDVAERLRIRFTCVYAATTEDLLIRLPVIYPKLGKVLSEKIWVERPWPPLSMVPLISPCLSPTAWQYTEQRFIKKQVLCFKRVELPSLIPEGLREDAIVWLRHVRLAPRKQLKLPGTKVDSPTDVIKSLHMTVKTLGGQRLECRMSFDLQVAQDRRLMVIEAAGWEMTDASIDGQDCTTAQGVPQWWVGEQDDCHSLYRDPETPEGASLEVAISFEADDDWLVRTEHSLPRVVDKSILGGLFTFSSIRTLLHITQAGNAEEFTFTNRWGGGSWRLPSLTEGYKLRLCFTVPEPSKDAATPRWKAPCKADRIRFSEGMPLQARAIRFEDDNSTTSSDTDGKLATAASSSYFADSYFADDERTEGISDLESLDSGNSTDECVSDSHKVSILDDCPGDMAAGREVSEYEEDEGDFIDGVEKINIPRLGNILDYVLHETAVFTEYMDRMSPMTFLIRFLILECMYFAIVRPSPERLDTVAFSLKLPSVSDMLSTTAEVLLGDFDASVQPLSTIELDESWNASQNEAKEQAAIGSQANTFQHSQRELNLRDRIDLALGWRPVHG
ncbi:MAG: hypothetical protein Q9212_004861 [Teloschistes hypoglaucus]